MYHASFGTSGMAGSDIGSITASKHVKLVAVADVDLKNAERLKKRFPDIKVYQDWRKLLDGSTDDICYIFLRLRCGPRQERVPPTVMRVDAQRRLPDADRHPWPSLPQVPMPGSSSRSLPTMRHAVSTSGPLPISVAPLTGAVDLAVLDQVGLGGREHEFAGGDVDLAAAEVDGVEAAASPRR